MPTFHHSLMTRLDKSTYGGRNLTPAHSAIRRALREANMKGRQFANLDELLTHIRTFSRLPAETIKAAA